MLYAENMLSFWESRILVCDRQRVPMLQPIVKVLGTKSLMNELPLADISYMLLPLTLWDSTRRRSWKLVLSFLWT